MSALVSFSDMQQMAKVITESKLFGITDVNQVLALGLVAQAEGQHFATAARDYHIVQNRPTLKADAMLSRFQQAGGKVNWDVYTDSEVSGTFTHPNGGSLTVTWTIDQAKAIGLVKPGSGWHKYPRAMLRSRTVSEGIRAVYPGCVIGTYTPEEAEDMEPPKVMKDVTPEPPKAIPKKPELEVSPAIQDIIDMEEGDAQEGFPLYCPNVEGAWKRFSNSDEWITGWQSLCVTVHNSTKKTAAQKTKDLAQLREMNEELIKTLLPAQQIQVIAAQQQGVVA